MGGVSGRGGRGSVWSAGVGACASGACARGLLSGTLSGILPYLLCQIAGLLFVL